MENEIREKLLTAIPKTKELSEACLKIGDIEMFNLSQRILDCLEKLTSGDLNEDEEFKYVHRLFLLREKY